MIKISCDDRKRILPSVLVIRQSYLYKAILKHSVYIADTVFYVAFSHVSNNPGFVNTFPILKLLFKTSHSWLKKLIMFQIATLLRS